MPHRRLFFRAPPLCSRTTRLNTSITLARRSTMKSKNVMTRSRRAFLISAASATAILALTGVPLTARAADAAKKLKIGIIGSGRIGGTVGELWVKAGHEV